MLFMRQVGFPAWLAMLAALLGGCATALPSLEGRAIRRRSPTRADTRLARALNTDVAAHPGKTGIHPLPSAGCVRGACLLAAAAERSLDVQYYIWHGDTTGYLLFEALWHAAERGVRVRLLLDDNNTAGLDPTIAALDATRTSRCACSTRSCTARARCWAMSPTSGA